MKKYFLLLSFLLPFLVNAQTNKRSYAITEQDRKNYVLQLAIDQKDMNNSSRFDMRGRTVKHVRLTLKNNSNNTLKFWAMTCTWGDFYEINNKDIKFFELGCISTCSIISLAPHQTHAVDMELFCTKNVPDHGYKFRIGMPLFKYSKNDRLIHLEELTFMSKHPQSNLIWSNEVDLL